jgi:hypothetical protein
LVRGLPIKEFVFNEKCISCSKGKQHKLTHKPKHVNYISCVLQLLHMDLFGPVSFKSLGKKSYCLVVTGDFSRFSWVNFLSSKDVTSEVLIKLLKQCETISGCKG